MVLPTLKKREVYRQWKIFLTLKTLTGDHTGDSHRCFTLVITLVIHTGEKKKRSHFRIVYSRHSSTTK
jgi:hypothetical protein